MSKEFSVVSGQDKMAFRDEVNHRLVEGYQPIGGVSLATCITPRGELKTTYALGMVREIDSSESNTK